MTNLEKAILWIYDQKRIDPNLTKARLIDEASQRFCLIPREGDYLWKNLEFKAEEKKL